MATATPTRCTEGPGVPPAGPHYLVAVRTVRTVRPRYFPAPKLTAWSLTEEHHTVFYWDDVYAWAHDVKGGQIDSSII